MKSEVRDTPCLLFSPVYGPMIQQLVYSSMYSDNYCVSTV